MGALRLHCFVYFFSVLHLSGHCFSQITSSVDEEVSEIRRSQFPKGFLFGTATSSYQVEGAWREDGRGLSNWDFFSRLPGKIKNGDNGDIADDHYHRYLDDIELMHYLGITAYRFSISWTRILPRGRFGEVNAEGVSFYNKLIDDLLLKGIEPFVTLNHDDIPQELEDRYGSWLSPLMQEDFVLYAKTCFESFGDRVKHWVTINEPNLFSKLAYMNGIYPPGHCSAPFGNCSVGNSDIEPLIAVHNMLLSHAKAARLYRLRFQTKQGGSIGIVANAFMYEPLRDSELDQQAVKRALAFNLAWVLDPLIFGDYPAEMQHYHGSELPKFSAEEVEYLKGSVDFIGVNHYSTLYAKDCLHSPCSPTTKRAISGFVSTTAKQDGVLIGDPMGIESFYVVPRGMEELINYLKNRYNNFPMFVTENGYCPPAKQIKGVSDILNDVKRIEFHRAYLSALLRAMTKGANVWGYFSWTLMDDFEWVDGYSTTFGLYYVDRHTLQRVPKLSAKWYSDFLNNNDSKCKHTELRATRAES